MIDVFENIANFVTIASMLIFTAYLWSELKDSKYHLTGVIVQLVKGNKEPIRWMWKQKMYLCIYFIVPLMLGISMILISQFHKGELRIRLNYQFFLSAGLWIFMVVKEKYQYDFICKLQETIKQLKDKKDKDE